MLISEITDHDKNDAHETNKPKGWWKNIHEFENSYIDKQVMGMENYRAYI